MARNKGAQQGNAAQAAHEPEQGNAAGPPPDDLDGFVHWCERAKLDAGVVLVSVSHPDIRAAQHRDGTYSGFAMKPGPLGAQWSDGSTHPAPDAQG